MTKTCFQIYKRSSPRLRGSGSLRVPKFLRINNTIFGINPQIHGFKTFYYGIGTLRK